MKREDIEWPILGGALAALLVSLVVSGALVGSSFYFEKRMAAEYQRNNALFQNISRRYLAVDEEEKLIKKFFPPFVDLHKRGVIGQEQRLNWIEVLRASGDDIGFPSLSYEIKSQAPYTPAFSVALGSFGLYSSEMNLNMQLLHEGDMLDLFEYLDKKAAGAFTVSACSFSRSGSSVDVSSLRPNIATKCSLKWFTIKLANGVEIKV